MVAIAVAIPSTALLAAEAQEFMELTEVEQVEQLARFVVLVGEDRCEEHPFYDVLTEGRLPPIEPQVLDRLDAHIAEVTGVSLGKAARTRVEAGNDLEIAVQLCTTLGLASSRMH